MYEQEWNIEVYEVKEWRDEFDDVLIDCEESDDEVEALVEYYLGEHDPHDGSRRKKRDGDIERPYSRRGLFRHQM